MKYEDMPFKDGVYEKQFSNGIKIIVTHHDYRKEYCNNIPNIEIYNAKEQEIKPLGGMCQPFGYTAEEINHMITEIEKYKQDLNK